MVSTLTTIILTALSSAFIAFIFKEFIEWKEVARKEKIKELTKLLEGLYSPLGLIINWITIRIKEQLESPVLDLIVKESDTDETFFVLHPHQYDKLWEVRAKFLHVFKDSKHKALQEIDNLFDSLDLFHQEYFGESSEKKVTKERWNTQAGKRIDAIKKKEEIKKLLEKEMEEIYKKVNKLKGVTDNLGKRILFFLMFWKL